MPSAHDVPTGTLVTPDSIALEDDVDIYDHQAFPPDLAADITSLRERVETTTAWDLETFMRHARIFEELLEDTQRVLDRADNYCEVLDPPAVEAALEHLDVIEEKLFAAEQNELLIEETFATAKAEYPSEPGDDEIVTVGIRVDPIGFRRPQAHILPLLLRQINGKRFDGSYRLLSIPRWLHRRIDLLPAHTKIWIFEVLEDVPTGEILEVANSLWEPRQESDYRSASAALAAARLLAE